MDAVVLQQRRQLYGPNAALSYDEPLNLVRGEGCWLVDSSETRYLDCVNNVTHCGHGNPKIAAAVAAQLGTLNTNSRYLSSELTAYCRELTDTLPGQLKTVYLVNSGSEANDLALRIASAAADARAAAAGPANGSNTDNGSSSLVRAQHKRDHVVVMAGAYHGHLTSLIPLSPYKFWGCGGRGREPWVHVMPMPDSYRGCNLDGAAAARAVLAQAAAAGGRVTAFFCEGIISCGGQVFLPPGYLADVYDVMRQAGVVCVADEVQTGFGRVGEAFWAFELQRVVPDIVTMGKPMGNGFPIGGLVTTPALAAAFAAGGMEYFCTYGGCNAAVAAGRAVLREIRDNKLQQHAAEVGRYIASLLSQLQTSFPHVLGDVRGVGLFWGVECVLDRVSKMPAPLLAKAIKEGAKQRGVLLSNEGPVGHVIKFKPPMVFGKAEAELMVATMREVLTELTLPDLWPEHLAAEQQHWQQQAAPIMARYAANEQQLKEVAAMLEAADAFPHKQLQQQFVKRHQLQEASLHSSGCSSDDAEDLSLRLAASFMDESSSSMMISGGSSDSLAAH